MSFETTNIGRNFNFTGSAKVPVTRNAVSSAAIL